MTQIKENIKVAIVEDDAGIRTGILQVLKQAPDIQCTAVCDSAEEALRTLPGLAPQVILMDINLPNMNGVECVRLLVPKLRGLQVIMLTVHDDTEAIFDSLAAGAMGYLLKPPREEELLAAIRDVITGGSPMTSAIARKVVQAFKKAPAQETPHDKLNDLTPRELEVLGYLAKGFLYKEVATELSISYNTVHTLVNRIYEKLQVRTRHAAVAAYTSGHSH